MKNRNKLIGKMLRELTKNGDDGLIRIIVNYGLFGWIVPESLNELRLTFSK